MLLIRLFVFALIVFICKFRLIYYLYFGDFLFGWLFLCVFFFYWLFLIFKLISNWHKKSKTDYSIFHGFTCKFYLISQSHLVSYSSLFNVIVDNFEFNKIVLMWTAN